MKNGLRVYDSDTHVLPAAEVLERHVDPAFRPGGYQCRGWRGASRHPILFTVEPAGGKR